MPKTALLLGMTFLVLGIGWRSLAHYRRLHDFGFRRPARDSSAAERLAGAGLLTGGAVLLASPACVLGGLVPLLEVPFGYGIGALGLLAASEGIAITVYAEFQMGDSWRVGVDPSEETALVREGLFERVRNPIYSGMCLFALGLTLLVPSSLSIAALIVFFLSIELQVRWVEEPYLERRHGARYRDYARHTGRFLPKVGTLG